MNEDLAVFDSDNEFWVQYIIKRGGDPEFFQHASFGDAMPFDRECVVLCVGKLWNVE